MKECVYLHQQQLPPAASYEDNSLTMPCWYYDKKELRDTPSILDGISFETERRYRKEGARFIMTCGTQMGLGHNTMATGVVYFHRFYMFQSFKSFPRYVTACCCLFLAGKVEETPKKCRDIIKAARSLLSDNYFYSFGEDPKEEVMTLERILLQTIKFDLQVEHPYSFLLKYAKCIKGDQQKLQKMVQMAWNFVNDSLSTVVCLQWEPEIIAVALIYLASKLSKFTIVDWVGRQAHHLRWWDMFVADVTMELIEDICHQVLDLYHPPQTGSSTSQSPPQNPPSRADSPPPVRGITANSSSSESPASKAKPSATVTSGSSVNATGSAATTTSSAAKIGNNVTGELSNIQAIKSLASTTTATSAIPEGSLSQTPIGNTYHMYAQPPPGSSHAPHQMHAMYSGSASIPPPPPPHVYALPPGSSVQSSGNVSNVVPPPLPPPPLAPYGAPPTNWQQQSSITTHYANVPPPLPPAPPHSQPHSSNRIPGPRGHSAGNYYHPHQHQSSNYGRQQRY